MFTGTLVVRNSPWEGAAETRDVNVLDGHLIRLNGGLHMKWDLVVGCWYRILSYLFHIFQETLVSDKALSMWFNEQEWGKLNR